MKLNKSAIVLCTCLAGAMSPALAGILVASDNFDTYTVSGLNGNNGGTGWAGAWADPSPTNASVVATNGADAPMAGNAIRFTGQADAAAARTLSTTIDRNVVVRFDFQFDAGAINNNDFMSFWFGTSGGPNIGLKANCGLTTGCTTDLFARTSGSDSGGTFQNIAIGTSYSLMGYLQKTGASTVYNRFDLWVNPTDLEVATLTGSDAFDTGASTLSSFSTIGFRTATLSGTDALLVDNLSLNLIPEPGTLALFGLALAGIAGISRRRKA